MNYKIDKKRYEKLIYRRCGNNSQNNLTFSNSELKEIDKYVKEEKINLWAKSSSD